MNTLNHLAISLAVKRVAENELGIKLDTSAFMFGNIRPDFTPRLLGIPHIKNASLDFVNSQIKMLMDTKLDQSGKCKKAFSDRLGVVMHFLADFFCFAHSDSFKGNLFVHFLYELKLGRYYKRNLRKISAVSHVWYSHAYEDYEVFHNSVNKLYDKYCSEEQSLALDTRFSFNVCVAAACSIISACLARDMEIAA